MNKFAVTITEIIQYEREIIVEAKTSFDAVRAAMDQKEKDTPPRKLTDRSVNCSTRQIKELSQ